MFLSSWYSTAHPRPRSTAAIDATASRNACNRIVDFEQMLADDGALILKFWMHLGKDAQKKRLKNLEKDPLPRWRVDEARLETLADVRQVRRAAEQPFA